MALSDLAIFNEQTHLALTEVVDQQIELFNGASNSTLTLRSAMNKGNYTETAMFAKISDLVRRRNPGTDGAVAATQLRHINDVSVRVAGGTKPVRMDSAWFTWIRQNQSVAAAALAQQLAKDMLQDMVNVAISSGYAALAQVSGLVYDGSAGKFSAASFVKGGRLFGDRAQAISGWLMHSSPVNDLFESNIANASSLFNYGTVNIVRDPFGRVMIVTDSPSLVTANGVGAGIDKFHTLGLVSDAIVVEQNGDFNATTQEETGFENIRRVYQAEWSYNLGVKGFAWDKANGGSAPTNAAIATSANWDKYVTSLKDTAGVVIETR